MYQPKQPFITPLQLFQATKTKINGATVKRYSESQLIYGTVRSFGGSESVRDGVYISEDTAVIDSWFTPNISAGDKVVMLDDNSEWEVIGTPEDIERKHRFIQFKVRRLRGNA